VLEDGLLVNKPFPEDTFKGMNNVITMHHGAVAGRDEAKNVRYAFIIGQQNPSPEACRRFAAALTGDPIQPETWVRKTGGILMQDGSGIALEVSRFQNPVMEMVRAHISDSSIIQDYDRPRGVRRTEANPVTIFLMSKIIVPFPVDNLLDWKDVSLSAGERMKARGVWTLSAMTAHALFPDLFCSEDAAKRRNCVSAKFQRVRITL
jgi:hypothetical protein